MGWKDIYNKRISCGSLNEEIHPVFEKFIQETHFFKKYALDIGCGPGKYIRFLEKNGFKADGLEVADNTGVKTWKGNIFVDDMFNFDIPKAKYDLILSIAALHHGYKENVMYLVERINTSLPDSGWVFITMPDKSCLRNWNSFKCREQVANDTYIPLKGPEKGIPHSFYSRKEVEKLLSALRMLKIDIDEIGRWVIRGKK